eukprot:TRINITY_DN5649_c0_g1_i1.p2 TRINITY_DN5649_c0_g1~~TRINITY_DN5649_c0_g1_i1.p2  ORF type:complete len:189 (-),score=57.97 TRINITY_DN5649_c0_g1_i1:25-591(-)
MLGGSNNANLLLHAGTATDGFLCQSLSRPHHANILMQLQEPCFLPRRRVASAFLGHHVNFQLVRAEPVSLTGEASKIDDDETAQQPTGEASKIDDDDETAQQPTGEASKIDDDETAKHMREDFKECGTNTGTACMECCENAAGNLTQEETGGGMSPEADTAAQKEEVLRLQKACIRQACPGAKRLAPD